MLGRMWNDLMSLGVSAPEKILRTVVVYLVLAVLLRLAGKRDLAQLNSFDLVVMLLLSNVVQNAVIGPDNSLLGGIVGATVLVAFNAVVVRCVAGLGAGLPAAGGHLDAARPARAVGHRRRCASEGLRQADVDAALRRQNANGVDDVETVSLEPGGAVVATLLPGAESATRADVERLEAKLDALLSRQR